MIINTNMTSLVTRDYLRKSNADLQSAMEKLSSGKRINKSSDDAAGLAIVSRMTTQVRGMEVAMRNAGDGISLIQTAESALGSISDVLQRMRELSVQADNGTYSDNDLASLQSEMSQLVSEIDHIATTSNFNGINLLDGSQASVQLHISDAATDVISVGLANAQTSVLGNAVKLNAINISSTGDAQVAIANIDFALDTISSTRANFGAMQNRLNFTIDNLSVSRQNVTSARSRIEDADMAEETSKMTRSKILNQSGIAMLAQANQNPQQILSLLQNN